MSVAKMSIAKMLTAKIWDVQLLPEALAIATMLRMLAKNREWRLCQLSTQC